MDRDQFDRLSRVIATAGTRRDALRALVVGAIAGVAAGAARSEEAAAARKRRKGRHRKVRGQVQVPTCPILPTTCTKNCDAKPLQGGSNLAKCNFNNRELDGVVLGGSNLGKACFGNASLRYADLRGTNAGGACFCGADLTGADFRGSNVTAAQLACATVACNTILPNGKPAKPCPPGKTCCLGECVDTDDDEANCGACGTECRACQICDSGQCENLPDGQFDCNGDPLVAATPGVCPQGLCTASKHTGICDLGFCNCGPQGVFDEEAGVCLCDQDGQDDCAETGDCCRVDKTCLNNGQYCSELTCVGCTSDSNLCCEYLCQAVGPGPRPKKFVCIENAQRGVTRCDPSFEGCSFNNATFLTSCSSCGTV